jgi:hypothetical protein
MAGGGLATKGSIRQRDIRGQKFCRRGWRPPVSFTVAVRLNRLPGKFCGTDQPTVPDRAAEFQSIPEASFRWESGRAFRGQNHRHHFVIVRIYYLEMRFIEGYAGVLRVQFCAPIAQGGRECMSYSSIDMNQKNQNTAATRRMALWKN